MTYDYYFQGVNPQTFAAWSVKVHHFTSLLGVTPCQIEAGVARDGYFYSDQEVRGRWVRVVVVPHGVPLNGGAAMALNIGERKPH